MNRDRWTEARTDFQTWRAQIAEALTSEQQVQLNRALNSNTPKDEAERLIEVLAYPIKELPTPTTPPFAQAPLHRYEKVALEDPKRVRATIAP